MPEPGGADPRPLCFEDDAATVPCRFVGVCHRTRQELQSRLLLRGEDCWAFELLRAEAAYLAPPPLKGSNT